MRIYLTVTGTKEGHRTTNNLWEHVAYRAEPRTAFANVYGDEPTTRIGIEINGEGVDKVLHEDQSKQLYERCVKAVEAAPETKEYHRKDVETRQYVRGLLQRYEELLH